MGKIVKYNTAVQYHKKCPFFEKKTFSSNVKQSTAFFFMNDKFFNTMN